MRRLAGVLVADATCPGLMRKVDTTRVPLSAYLGAVGMPGVTAWYGLMKICQPKRARRSSSARQRRRRQRRRAAREGARLPRRRHRRRHRQVRYVRDELGFDACVDYKAHADPKSLYDALKEATPDGVDGCFENVGGAVLDVTLARMNAFGRIALCGMISGYDGAPIPLQQPQLILQSRLLVQGFIVSEHMEVWPEALKELGTMVATGKLKYRETVADGLAAAPEAFLGLLKGRNFGKQLVRLV
jgi:NADPH-dependent curcumin reductase CurA